MASKQSMQFLASQLMGLGDRGRASAQQDKTNAMQERYFALAQNKSNEEREKLLNQQVFEKFGAAYQMLGSTPDAAAKAYSAMTPEEQQRLGPMGSVLEQMTLPPGMKKDAGGTFFGAPQTGIMPVGGVSKPRPSGPIGAGIATIGARLRDRKSVRPKTYADYMRMNPGQ